MDNINIFYGIIKKLAFIIKTLIIQYVNKSLFC